jgi:hypothetical protein
MYRLSVHLNFHYRCDFSSVNSPDNVTASSIHYYTSDSYFLDRYRSFRGVNESSGRKAARLIQRDGREQPRIELAVPDALVVRQVETVSADLFGATNEAVLHPEQAGVPPKLLPDTERRDDQVTAADLSVQLALDLALDERLAQAERCEDGGASETDRPYRDITLVRKQQWVNIGRQDIDASAGRNRYF